MYRCAHTQANFQTAFYRSTIADNNSYEQWLAEGEHTVGGLAQRCGCSPANVSRHLALLMRHGLVQREQRGHSAWYRCADASVGALCDGVCSHLARLAQRQRVFGPN